ncbi:MAG TPA: hypothetical protein V6C86_23435 [Oculatellaceae cyanobacterium]
MTRTHSLIRLIDFLKRHTNALLLVTACTLSGSAAFAGLREDAAYYYRMWRQTDAQAAAVAASNPFAGLGYVPEIAKWKGLYDKAMAELRKQEREEAKHPSNPEQPAQQDNPVPPNRGYGPPRTGLDWQPFLANLRPKALTSALRQGDNFANQGDWASALKDYDLASRIDPANQLARQKASDARDKLKQTPTSAPPPGSTPPTAAPSPPTGLPNASPSQPTAAPLSSTAALPTVPTTLPGSQGLPNAANAPGFHPTTEQLQKRIQLDDESQQSVGSFFRTNSGVVPK